MSTNPDDRLVNVLSHWLARHVDDAQLRRELERTDVGALPEESREAVEELRRELEQANGPGALERTVRETLEALALGV
jgi:hypothetical protein